MYKKSARGIANISQSALQQHIGVFSTGFMMAEESKLLLDRSSFYQAKAVTDVILFTLPFDKFDKLPPEILETIENKMT